LPPISILIKPVSSMCNLKCRYCFYHATALRRQTENFGLMDLELLEELVVKTLEFADGFCTFAFQGGEPTMIGLPFYEKLIEFQKLHNKKGIKINNSLQTNGLLITQEWAKFLAQNNFLVGLSLDGPKEMHDMQRVDASKKGSYKQVMDASKVFDKYNVEYNILSVITANTARHATQAYNFFKKNGFKYLQFIPCLDPLDEQPGGNDYSLTPSRFTEFLKVTFDLWFRDWMNKDGISIRFFDNLISMMVGYPPESCGMSGVCSLNFVIESNGGVYPCDFYVNDEWLLGNIKVNSFQQLIETETTRRFIDDSKIQNEECIKCNYFNLCRGGCRRNREPFKEGCPDLNYYCESYKEFLNYAGERMHQVARMVANHK